MKRRKKMTARELIKALQDLGDENLDKDCITFDGPAYGIVSRVKILDDKWSKRLQGKIMID